MSVKIRFHVLQAIAEDGPETPKKSSVYEGARTVLRTNARIEAKTVEIRDSKATGIYTTYAKGRAETTHRLQLSASANMVHSKD